jgi:hypothetical protein
MLKIASGESSRSGSESVRFDDEHEEAMITKRKSGAGKSSVKTLLQVKNEMAKPRVTASARAPIAKSKRPVVLGGSLIQASTKVFQLQETGVAAANRAILKEVERLTGMSQRLKLLADEHSSAAKALLPISASILGIATVLKVLVISKASTPPV